MVRTRNKESSLSTPCSAARTLAITLSGEPLVRTEISGGYHIFSSSSVIGKYACGSDCSRMFSYFTLPTTPTTVTGWTPLMKTLPSGSWFGQRVWDIVRLMTAYVANSGFGAVDTWPDFQ